jgi:hypothetical protein
VSAEKSASLKWLLYNGVLMGALLMLAGCVSGPEYTAGGSPIVRVLPSKGWWKAGVSGKEAWETWHNYCTKVSEKLWDAEACMKEKGFAYGKLTEEQVYVPPPPPRMGWVKPGVSRLDSVGAWNKCSDMRRNSSVYVEKCMTEQGFVYRELTEEELPLCRDALFPPCRPDPVSASP